MRKLILTLFLILAFIEPVGATRVQKYFDYTDGSEVNHTNLNGNIDNLVNWANGGVANDNLKSGYNLIEILSALPVAGSEGRVVYNTTSDILAIDNGTAFVSTPTYTGTAVSGDLAYFDGTTWARSTAIANFNVNLTTTNGFNIDNDGTNHALYIKQDGVLATDKYSLYLYSNADQDDSNLMFVHQDNASSGRSPILIQNDSSTAAAININSPGLEGILVGSTAADGAHLFLTPVGSSSYATEGGIYTDTDNRIYYYNGSAWEAMDNTADFAELMQCEGNKSNYEIGDVIVIGTELIDQSEYEVNSYASKEDRKNKKKKKKILDEEFSSNSTKVKKSNSPYQKNVIGVVSGRSGFNLTKELNINKRLIIVGLIGLVKCKVNSENGAIAVGDLLTTSSTEGEAMKATIDSFDKIGSIIGKAREAFNGTSGVIEIIVGVH